MTKESSESKREESIGVKISLKSWLFWSELLRKIVQATSFVLFNGAFLGLPLTAAVFPVLWTLGANYRTVGEAFGTIQGLIYNLVFPWLPLASIFLFAALTGRLLCGWVCPFGLVEDLLGYVKRSKRDFSPQTHRSMANAKYVFLALTIMISIALAAESLSSSGPVYGTVLGPFAEGSFTTLSPSDTLFAVIPKLGEHLYSNGYQDLISSISSPLLWVRLVVLVGVLAFAVYIPRSWCRYLCPQGAFLALGSRFSFLGLKRDPLKCVKTSCKTCEEVCPTRVPILDLSWEKFTDAECIYCLRCVMACHTKAIRPKLS